MKNQRTFPFPTNIFSFLLLMRLPRGLESLNHLIFCADGRRRGCFLYYPIQFYDMVRHKSPEKWEHVTSSTFFQTNVFINRSSFITSNFKINGSTLCGPFMRGLLRHLDKTISSLIYSRRRSFGLLDQYLRGYFLSCG